MSHLIVKTYVEASQAVEQLGILPLSGFIPAHPSLNSITEPTAWHTGTDTDPWHWRDCFASEGIACAGYLGHLFSQLMFCNSLSKLSCQKT